MAGLDTPYDIEYDDVEPAHASDPNDNDDLSTYSDSEDSAVLDQMVAEHECEAQPRWGVSKFQDKLCMRLKAEEEARRKQPSPKNAGTTIYIDSDDECESQPDLGRTTNLQQSTKLEKKKSFTLGKECLGLSKTTVAETVKCLQQSAKKAPEPPQVRALTLPAAAKKKTTSTRAPKKKLSFKKKPTRLTTMELSPISEEQSEGCEGLAPSISATTKSLQPQEPPNVRVLTKQANKKTKAQPAKKRDDEYAVLMQKHVSKDGKLEPAPIPEQQEKQKTRELFPEPSHNKTKERGQYIQERTPEGYAALLEELFQDENKVASKGGKRIRYIMEAHDGKTEFKGRFKSNGVPEVKRDGKLLIPTTFEAQMPCFDSLYTAIENEEYDYDDTRYRPLEVKRDFARVLNQDHCIDANPCERNFLHEFWAKKKAEARLAAKKAKLAAKKKKKCKQGRTDTDGGQHIDPEFFEFLKTQSVKLVDNQTVQAANNAGLVSALHKLADNQQSQNEATEEREKAAAAREKAAAAREEAREAREEAREKAAAAREEARAKAAAAREEAREKAAAARDERLLALLEAKPAPAPPASAPNPIPKDKLPPMPPTPCDKPAPLTCDQNDVESMKCPQLRSELQSKYGYPASKVRYARKSELVELVLQERQTRGG